MAESETQVRLSLKMKILLLLVVGSLLVFHVLRVDALKKQKVAIERECLQKGIE